MFADQMGNAVGQCPGFATARTSHYKQRTFVVIDRPSLGVIEAGKKAHQARIRSKSIC